MEDKINLYVDYVVHGWPDHEKGLHHEIKPYFAVRAELSIWNGILLHRDRLIIPDSLRPETLNDIHLGHLRLDKCREHAKSAVWWPGIGKYIKRIVKSCEFCLTHQP
jgi:hypothetical protein